MAFLFFTKRPSNCYVINARVPFYDFCEYAVIYYKHYNSLIHEILHLFGAADLYFPKEVSDIAKEMFPESIMFNSAYNKIDDFTKYVTGIYNEHSLSAKVFMDKTKDLTGEYIDAFLKEQWTDGFRRVRYSNGMIYEGNFKTIKVTELENSYIPIRSYMKGSLGIMNVMGMGNLFIQEIKFTKGNLRTVK